MSGVWRCRKCWATDVPLNGRTRPVPFRKCQFGAAVGFEHQWEELSDHEWKKLQEKRAEEKAK